MNMQPHIATAEDNIAPHGILAVTCPAQVEHVQQVVSATFEGSDGRSVWAWLRLTNDDLALAVFPQGDTYEAAKVHTDSWPAGTVMYQSGSDQIAAGDPIAMIHPANPDYVDSTLSAHLTDDAVPNWTWIRLANGDLAAGVFIEADLPDVILEDAAWPGLSEDEPQPGF
ncbi:MAG: hypothetical protein ABJN42_07440 [Roseibium sp.]|uniref:hypothetical protein n=1 Tax=Roseibium sp. TaxID=1936156 RepID=UPI003299620E